MKNMLLGLLAAVVLFGHSSADETAVRQQFFFPITDVRILGVAAEQGLSSPLSSTCSATNNLEADSTSFFRKHSRVLSIISVGTGSLLASWIIVSMMRRQQTGD